MIKQKLHIDGLLEELASLHNFNLVELDSIKYYMACYGLDCVFDSSVCSEAESICEEMNPEIKNE